MKTKLTPQENKLIDEYWNEHDGDTFYKDELKELISQIKSNAVEKEKERIEKEMRKEANSNINYFGNKSETGDKYKYILDFIKDYFNTNQND